MTNRYESVACGGMDVHYKFSTVTWRDESGGIVLRERLDHTDRSRLLDQMAGWPKGVPLVMEASFGWGWLSDVATGLGLEACLSNCYKVEQMRKARGWVKTNKKDADLLSLLAFEATPWWRVWRAPAAVRDRRERIRHRADLVAIQTETKNRIHAIFHRHGVFHEFSDLFGGKGRRFLAALCGHGRHAGGVLSDGALEALRGQVDLLVHLRDQLALLARGLRANLERDTLTKRLTGIPGTGLILSHVMRAEIGRIERFGGHRSLASYSLLAPRSSETGEPPPGRAPRGRHLGRQGNRTLKWAFIEAAHGAVRHGGKWRAMFDRYTDGGKKSRGRGYIKVAREWVKVVYVVWAKGATYTETPPPRPGSRRRRRKAKRTSRSGTGQPCTAMVGA